MSQTLFFRNLLKHINLIYLFCFQFTKKFLFLNISIINQNYASHNHTQKVQNNQYSYTNKSIESNLDLTYSARCVKKITTLKLLQKNF